MDDTAPRGGVTKSPLRERHEHDQQHDPEGDEGQAADAAGRAVSGPLRDGILAPADVDGALRIGHERTERHTAAAVKGQTGDVDGQGDVVDELVRQVHRKVNAARLILAVGNRAAVDRAIDEAEAAVDELRAVFAPVSPERAAAILSGRPR